MNHVETAAALLVTVEEARSWLLELTDSTVRERPTTDRWSIAEVIGHMVDSACNNHQRFIRAQEAEALTFPKYDQRSWVDRARYHESAWTQLVELWRLYNIQLAGVINAIPVDQLKTPCTIIPHDTCTLEFLITDYLDHTHHHLMKIRERLSTRLG